MVMTRPEKASPVNSVLARINWLANSEMLVGYKSEIEKYSEADIEKLDKRLNAQFKKGTL